MSTKRLTNAFVFGAVALATMGCNEAYRKVAEAPITGKVTLDGKPLAGAAVTFVLSDFSTTLVGATTEDGSYQLWSPLGGDAKCQGSYKVTISSYGLPGGGVLPPGKSPTEAGAVQLLPKKYADLTATTLSAEVPEGGGSFDFALQSR